MARPTRPTYEMMYVVNTVLNDAQIDEICDRVVAYIADNGGEILEEERWGNRRLAYPIEKKRNGYYGLVWFRADPDFIARLDRVLRINDDIMRHLILRYDAKMERHRARQRKAAQTPAEETPTAEAAA